MNNKVVKVIASSFLVICLLIGLNSVVINKALALSIGFFSSARGGDSPSNNSANITKPGFGGVILSYIVPTGVCPPHTLILDYSKRPARVIGLFVRPGQSKIFANFNLVEPGTFVLGTHDLLPAFCPAPYPIFPLETIGTS